MREVISLANTNYQDTTDGTPEEIWDNFFKFSQILHLEIDCALKEECGFDLPQYLILTALANAPEKKLQLGELARQTVFSPSRLNYRLGEMEKKGWLNRLCQGSDKRTRNACLSTKGLNAYEAAAKVQLKAVRELFAGRFSQQDLNVMRHVLSNMRIHLENKDL